MTRTMTPQRLACAAALAGLVAALAPVAVAGHAETKAHHAAQPRAPVQPMPDPRIERPLPDMSGGNAAAGGNNANSMSGSNSAGENANGRSSGGYGG
ncbi:hypothetical protein [Bradyrhizobium sp. 2TAF24]|uniref:hypothetical protein n=1 Tax=Bradyrhizobium sp. 2TAF24 TaxID=3233011 RepID=UPI003F917E63